MKQWTIILCFSKCITFLFLKNFIDIVLTFIVLKIKSIKKVLYILSLFLHNCANILARAAIF